MSYVSRKVPLKGILRDQCYHPRIEDAVIRANQITFHTYNILNLFALHLSEFPQLIPSVDKKFIMSTMRAISTTRDRKEHPVKDPSYQIMKEYFNTSYQHILQVSNVTLYRDKIDQLLDYEALNIETCIKNNIQKQFLNRLKEYVNLLFELKRKHQDVEISDLERSEKTLSKEKSLNYCSIDQG